MHTRSIEGWKHEHVFLGRRHDRHERRTMCVVALTAAMMVTEIVGGTLFGSMALVADGWHMSTHAAALAIAALAYRFARLHAGSARFAFGTGKLGELAAFASAIILAMIALFIGYESVVRLYQPIRIHFAEALPIAGLGLLVNLASAWLLRDDHAHDDEDDDAHHHDTNIRAAYVHVMARRRSLSRHRLAGSHDGPDRCGGHPLLVMDAGAQSRRGARRCGARRAPDRGCARASRNRQ